MFYSHVTPAIVLRAWPFGESDKIVSFLTENYGKVTGIAKGAKRSRRRFVNSLEPFSLVTLRFQERRQSSLAFILASDLTRSFKHLTTSLEKISYASYIVEITDGLIGERDENAPVFQHLKNGLGHLDERAASPMFLTAFELRLLHLAGYEPLLDRCKGCGTDRHGRLAARWHFSARDGGILCELCSRWTKDILPLTGRALEVLNDLQAEESMAPGVLLPAPVVKEIRSAVQRFIQFHVDREIKSASFLDDFPTTVI
jgi:DNA repair protein RecO (recombination protein O)